MSNYIDTKPFDHWNYSEHFDGALTEDAVQGMNTVLAEIDRQPVIKLVRCKDCFYYRPSKNKNNWGHCSYWSDGCEPPIVEGIDFCSNGFISKKTE